MITLQNIYKTFRQNRHQITAVQDLNLKIKKGEVFGFLGPNGAGKTTTLKLILGFLTPTSGSIKINQLPHHQLDIKKIIGFLPENPHFYQYLTAEEFLIFCGSLFKIPSVELKKQVQKLLKLVQLEEKSNIALRHFSKGMLQRIGIAQSLINNPQLLFWDEPMSGLDPLGRKLVKNIVSKLKKEGVTIFFNTHILEDVEKLCDRVGIIHHGQLLKVTPLSKLPTNKSLEDFFLETIQAA